MVLGCTPLHEGVKTHKFSNLNCYMDIEQWSILVKHDHFVTHTADKDTYLSLQ